MKIGTLVILLITTINCLYSQVRVSGYTRKNGTYVAPHTRSSPNSSIYDNYSYKGNINPYNGTVGTRTYEYENGKRQFKSIANKKVAINHKAYFYPTNGNNKKISFINEKKQIEILGKSDNGYYYIRYGDVEGFLEEKFIPSSETLNFIDKEKSDTIKAIYRPTINMDTIKTKLAIVATEKAYLIESSDNFENNIIETLNKGDEIQVLYHEKDGFYVVKHDNNLGLMLGLVFKIKDNLENNLDESKKKKLSGLKSIFKRN